MMDVISSINLLTEVIFNPRPLTEQEWGMVLSVHPVHELDDFEELTIAQVAKEFDLISSFNDVRKQRTTLRMNNKVVDQSVALDKPIEWIEDPNGIDHWCSLRASKNLEQVLLLTPSIPDALELA